MITPILSRPVLYTAPISRALSVNSLHGPSFEGKKKNKLKTTAMVGAAGTASLMSYSAALAAYLAILFGQGIPLNNYETKITPDIEWGENTKVLAAGRQRHYSLGVPQYIRDNFKINLDPNKINSFYTNKIVGKLRQGKAGSIPEAHKQLEEEGLKFKLQGSVEEFKRGDSHEKSSKFVEELQENGSDSISKADEKINFKMGDFEVELQNDSEFSLSFPQYPVATPHDIDVWKISDKGKNRIILAIGGDEDRSKEAIKSFCDEISDIFSVPEENIIRLPSANKDSVKKSLDELAEKVKNSNPENTEILIYYAGHGSTTTREIPLFDYLLDEGKAKGIAKAGFTEKDLKNFEKENLKGVKTLIIMDTCHSGAWIAKNKIAAGENSDLTA